ncbi:hypothetical protein O181_037612 [Austropuccinia psidii MF-1]|uniref:Reverse transcriptase domain-containing protein n=1 Tax=Austropuccinia psidii MF-1 TaxID=1389203 RepID=A0A9Q3DD33_9BASI|nr:hypothetical protein [Austropuccinia psidii MF-1]
MPFGIKHASGHFQRMRDTIFQEEILEVWMIVYLDDIIIYSETWEDHVQYIDKLRKLPALGNKGSGLSLAIDQKKVAAVLQKQVPIKIEEMQSFLGFASYYKNHIKRRDAYERNKKKLTNAPVLILPQLELPFKSFIDAARNQCLGAALHQRQILDVEPREGVICYISRQLKDSKDRYGATQTECLCLFWSLGKLHYYLEGAVFEVYTDCTTLKSLLNMKTANRHMLRWQIAIQEYKRNLTIIYKEGKIHTNADSLSRWPLDNVKGNPAYEHEAAAKITIHFMEIDSKKTSDFLNGNQKVVPQTVETLIQKEQKLPYWEYAPQN